MLPFTYYEYEANKEKEAQHKEHAEPEAQDPLAKSKALGVGSLMTAGHDELNEKFISKHASRPKKPDYKKENEAYDGPVRSYILPRDSWNILDGPSLLKH